MRKRIAAFAAAALVVAMFATPALAHGRHGGRASARNYSLCEIESCTLRGLHDHNGTYYYPHSYGDGHDYHEYCDVADCVLAGYHDHDGEYYFGCGVYGGHGRHHGGGGRY